MSTPDPTPAPTRGPSDRDASAGQRVGGLLLDFLLVQLPLFIVGAVLFGDSQASDGSVALSLDGLPFLVVVVLVFGYYVGAELAFGRTLGKLVVGTRVVTDSGAPLTAGPVLIRTVLRLVDGFFFYLVAFVAVLASPKNQRIGDMAASTRVVRTR